MSRHALGDIACPSCQSGNNRVTDTSGRNDKTMIRRRRLCLACNARFTTHEVVTEGLIVSRKELRAQLVDVARSIAEISNGLA